MQAVAHNPAFAKKAGVPQSVGKEFTKSGGGMAESKKMVKKEVSFMKKKGAPKSMIKHEMGEMKGMKKGGMTKKMAVGGVGTPTAKAQAPKRVSAPPIVMGSKANPNVTTEIKAQKLKNETNKTAYAKANPERSAYFDKKQQLASALGKERGAAAMIKYNQPTNVRGLGKSLASMNTPRGMFGANIGKNPKTQAEQDYMAHTKTYRAMDKLAPVDRPSKKMASGGLAAGHKSADGIASKGKTKGKMMAKGGIAMKKGKYC